MADPAIPPFTPEESARLIRRQLGGAREPVRAVGN